MTHHTTEVRARDGQGFPERVFSAGYAARGWILLVPFILIVAHRASLSETGRPLRWGLLGLVIAGMGLRLWAGAHAGSHTNGARAGAPVLATSGPYAYSRHPLYLSNLAVGAGLVFFANASPAIAILVLVFLFLHHLALALHEEKQLKRLWPETYAAYASATPRWFGLRPPAESEARDRRGDWRGARARQGRNLLYALACVVIVWAASKVG